MKVAQPCPTLCDRQAPLTMGFSQVRVLKWAAVRFSRGSSRPRDQTVVSCIAGRFFTTWATREVHPAAGAPLCLPLLFLHFTPHRLRPGTGTLGDLHLSSTGCGDLRQDCGAWIQEAFTGRGEGNELGLLGGYSPPSALELA